MDERDLETPPRREPRSSIFLMGHAEANQEIPTSPGSSFSATKHYQNPSPLSSLRVFNRTSSLSQQQQQQIAEASPASGSSVYYSMRHQRPDASGLMERLRTSMVGKSRQDFSSSSEKKSSGHPARGLLSAILGQIPAVALVGIFHLMIGIPFGVSYFPMYWSSHVVVDDNNTVSNSTGPFPLPGKEALGIRMFFFSTIVGQLVFTFFSGFPNPISLQMIENVPFCQELSAIVIRHQGFGLDALSTLTVMFGLASIFVGVVFWVLGRFELGRIVYFFPTHVLIGCIGGIGVFIAKTGIEVTMAETFSMKNILERWNLLSVVLAFEVILRILEQVTLDEQGKPRYTLLSPIYFCLITPIFYLGLVVVGVSVSDAEEAGFFFPPLDNDDGGSNAGGSSSMGHLWDMWRVIHFPTISWMAIWDAIPTLVALTLFSLIHVPINIPAFALSTNTDADMNNELIAHGYSNILVGLFGGLQNYMAYTQSVLYDKSGGTGRASGVAVAMLTCLFFFVGPTIAAYIPICMAGTLLLHVGTDLFLEGVWDTYGKFDALEYCGIWLIVVIMSLYGMEAAMIAGVIAAVSTYAVQSVAYLSPIRGSMPATTLRSSCHNRGPQAASILNSPTEGRSQILVVQLHGHLFFGNMAHFTESMHSLVNQGKNACDDDGCGCSSVVVIIDFALVLGIDSSAARTIIKLKDDFLKKCNVELCIFVTGSNKGFPTEYNLSKQLSGPHPKAVALNGELEQIDESTVLLAYAIQREEEMEHKKKFTGSRVFDTLDEALIFAEDALISRQDPSLLRPHKRFDTSRGVLSQEYEKEVALAHLKSICPVEMQENDPETLFALFERETYRQNDLVWAQHSPSDCCKLLVFGMLISKLENEAGTTETISEGNMIGETGLVNQLPRFSSVRCLSEEAIVYSLSRHSFEELIRTNPRVARYIDLICVNYLSNRVQHVSNRIFETRCLPI